MQTTTHRFLCADSRDLSHLASDTVDLVVTSPPYPMIEMWDGVFAQLNPEIGAALEAEEGRTAFSLMHLELCKVWSELARVVRPGGFLCVNIGDATRSVGGSFSLYPNHARIVHDLHQLDLEPMPVVLWRKQTNAPNKFMGSGMLPAGAYVTLEHEYILIFRKGGKRVFVTPADREARRASSYFWEERNVWFSDVWDFKGRRQPLADGESRERSGAFPFELAYRLINMYSVSGDTVLDPFLGTGTTTAASMASCRNSIGVEVDPDFADHVSTIVQGVRQTANDRVAARLQDHVDFVREHEARKGSLKHRNRHYGFPVVTSQETDLLLPMIASVEEASSASWLVHYEMKWERQGELF